MKVLCFLIILILGSSCQKSKNKFIYAEGFFTVDKTLYFSNGRSFYCSFDSWEEFYKLRGNEKLPETILKYDKLPEDMKFIKKCNLGIITKKFYE